MPCSKPRARRAATRTARRKIRSRTAGEASWRVGELYVERRGSRSIVGNIYKGVVDNVLPGMEAAFVDIGLERNGFLHVDEIVTPDGKAGPEARPRPGPADRRADQARPGDRRPGRQGPAEDEGRAPVDAGLDRRPLPRLHAAGRRDRRQPPAPRRRARRRCARASRRSTTPSKEKGGYIVRTAAQGAKKEDFEREIAYLHKLHEVLERRSADVEAPVADLPGGGPADPGAPRRARQRVRRRRDRRPEAVRAGHVVLPAHRAGARRLGRDALAHRAPVRAPRRRGGVPLDALAAGRPALGRLPDHRLRRGADGDRHQHRLASPARARGGSRTRSRRSTSRPPTRSSASCGCATSAGSSSSTSSTWRGRRTATRS